MRTWLAYVLAEGKGEGMKTIGSLFDGIGGFPLAFSRHGFTPLWASEIEPFPIRVTGIRFPDMLQYGDITKLDGGRMWPVDVVTGGSPCQDLSVAGKREGMKHEALGDDEATRSGLFMEQTRIVRQMREKTGDKPRFMVWENVPGALSSNGGEDFRIVLEETARIADVSASIPRPADGWDAAGAIMADGYSIAWRILDAQYWGVPQRRRRIYLVADFGGGTAPEILFKREGLRRNTAPGGEAGQGIAGDAARGFRETGQGYWGEGIGCLRAEGENRPSRPSNVVIADCQALSDIAGTGVGEAQCWPNVSSTLPRRMDGSPCIDRGPQMIYDARGNGNGEISPTMTGAHNARISDYTAVVAFAQNKRDEVRDLDDKAGALSAEPGMKQQTYVAGTVSSKWAKGTGGPAGDECQNLVNNGMAARRLTPLECDRLQGYPDNWTLIPGASDSARYKADGNSVAIPCVEYVAEGIAIVLRGGRV
jgi:DNA (cytosine-5)-methyltransferase 1